MYQGFSGLIEIIILKDEILSIQKKNNNPIHQQQTHDHHEDEKQLKLVHRQIDK